MNDPVRSDIRPASALRVAGLSQIDVGRFVVQEERVEGRSAAPERHVAVSTVRDGLIVRERLLR